MKFIILAVCIAVAFSVSLRREEKETSLVQTKEGNCVTVYEKCHFEGASTTVCDHG